MEVDPNNLKVVLYPHNALRVKANELDPTDPAIAPVAHKMIELMHESDGVGLAGPQVGLPWRIFVTNARERDPEDRVFINPRLDIAKEPPVSAEEGCLSLPGIHVNVKRPPRAVVTAVGLDGESFTMEDDELLSRIWQHENDHLNGVLIIDKMSQMDRISTRRALKELRAEANA